MTDAFKAILKQKTLQMETATSNIKEFSQLKPEAELMRCSTPELVFLISLNAEAQALITQLDALTLRLKTRDL
jgi:hypothetical protein